jgi:alkanesulfonate monooxygenase SsuD/methylene tetrahydromethanopterin reductase-like flavin-dependent oxidoreductase (luciferase family)
VYVGASYIAERVRPLLPDSARIVACLPVAVTDAPDAARLAIDQLTKPSIAMPAYARIMELQKAERVSDLSLIGSQAEVEDGLARLAEAGVTDFNPVLVGTEEDPGCLPRTRELLASKARAASD